MAHFLKFAVVGGIGFLINSVGLILGVKVGLKPSLAGPLGAEAAIVSNFILNNFWTFSDKSLSPASIPGKFIQFNILSMGAVLIQFVFLKTGEMIFGLENYKKPILNQFFFPKLPILPQILKIDLLRKLSEKLTAYYFVFLLATGVGLVVNYTVYSLIIWK